MKKSLPLICALVSAFVLLGQVSTAFAELKVPSWQSVYETLDCDGTTILIDAVTDPDIPSQANEWAATGRIITEQELRDFLAVFSPGDENLDRQPRSNKTDIALYDKDHLTVTSASSYIGYVDINHLGRLNKNDYGEAPYAKYYSYEPVKETVPALERINFAGAIALIQPLIDQLGYEAGYPARITAWDAKTLQQNYKWFTDLFPQTEKLTWTADDEHYHTIFPVYFKGMRLDMQSGFYHDGYENEGAGIDVTVDGLGISNFQSRNCMFESYTPLTQPQAILTLPQAIECYREMHVNMISTNTQPIIINKILLEYLVLKEIPCVTATYHLVPAWCFYYETLREGEEIPYQFHETIHAITGEPIMY